MPEPITNSQSAMPVEPELRRAAQEPKGVFQKNLKTMIYLGAALLVILAAVFSSTGKKTTQKTTSAQEPPQPMLQDATDNNVQDMKATIHQQAEQQKSANDPLLAQQALGPNGQPTTCVPGKPCMDQTGYAQQQLNPIQQQEMQLAAKDKELAYAARFASNIVYRTASDESARQTNSAALAEGGSAAGARGSASSYMTAQDRAASSLVTARSAGDQSNTSSTQPTAQKRAEVNIDSATGQPYVIYEGTTLDTVLMNRLDGDAAGPVKVLVSNPLYSHDRQHVLIPDGTIVLGEARKIGSTGFGQQRRMAVVFHRIIMPDGYSVDLDQFHGLDQIGEEGLKDKVNNHYLQIFGTSIALGVIAGAGEIEQGGGTISTSGSQAFTTGASSSLSQSATTVLDRFLQIPPTITIREGHRVKVYFTQDMLLPAYEKHTIPQTF
jgi:type IV secretory pathway VirB10-like protein